jgi:hypothetical protein
MIHLGITNDERLIMASNQAMPSDIARVEYYRDQKLFMLVYEDKEHGDELMPCEMSDDVSHIIKTSPDVIIVVMAQEGQQPYEYIAPLVQIGL